MAGAAAAAAAAAGEDELSALVLGDVAAFSRASLPSPTGSDQ